MRRLRHIALAVVAVATGALLVPTLRTSASAEPAAALRSPSDTVRWAGHFGAAGAGVTSPELCPALVCDERTLQLDLGGRHPRGSGLQVGIRWADEQQDLDLFVYGPDGAMVGRSDGFFASLAESVFIPEPIDGHYRIVVAPRHTEGLAYEGVAQLERTTNPVPRRDLLPDLVALPVRHATFHAGAFLLPEPSLAIDGCYPDERLEHGARRCLRFDQVLGNEGEGPFELRYDMTSLGTSQHLYQRVQRSDGTWWERPAGSYEVHATHGHFHYRNFAVSRLWASDDRGRRLGQEPVRIGRKNGFCVVDIDNVWFGRRGDAARSYYFPQCHGPVASQAEPVLRQGISVGWADVYNWFLPGQYIEATGLTDGYYLIETIADADGMVLEADEDNNSSTTLIQLSGEGTDVRVVP